MLRHLLRSRRLQQLVALIARHPHPRVHLLDLPDRPLPNQPRPQPILNVRVNLVPHLRHHPLLRRQQPHLPRLPHRLRQRLLTIHMLPRPHRRHRHRRMHVVRRRHAHRVNLIPQLRKHLPEIRKVRHPGKGPVHLVKPLAVNVAKSHKLHPRMLPDVLDVTEPHPVHPHRRHLQFGVRARTASDRRKPQRRHRQGTRLDESTTGRNSRTRLGHVQTYATPIASFPPAVKRQAREANTPTSPLPPALSPF